MGVCFHFAPNNLSHSQSSGASETLLHPLALREAEGLCMHLMKQAEAGEGGRASVQVPSTLHMGGQFMRGTPLAVVSEECY